MPKHSESISIIALIGFPSLVLAIVLVLSLVEYVKSSNLITMLIMGGVMLLICLAEAGLILNKAKKEKIETGA
jgi:hypothetical protein